MRTKCISRKKGTFLHAPLIIAVLLVALGVVSGCSNAPPEDAGRPRCGATVFPLYDIARNVAGDKMDVIQILPPGASPHTYEVSPRQVKQLQGVSVVFSIGHGLDDWADTLVDTVPGARKFVVDDGIQLREFAAAEDHGEHGHDEAGHDHEGVNPHYWLSVENGKIIAQNIAREAIRIDPANETYYNDALQAYLGKLDEVKRQTEQRMKSLPDKKIITFHNAWFYFAEEFGLEIVGTFEPSPGKQPTPRHMADLQDMARRHDVSAVFSEPQLSKDAVASFVEDIGLKLSVLDPLGGVEGRDSYINLIKYNTDVVVGALSDG
jgi:zinc transport system substrate-binding protein